MWKWSKEIVNRIKKSNCITDKDLMEVEIGTRLLTNLYIIQGALDSNGKINLTIFEDKIDREICIWSENVMEMIRKSGCLTEEEFNFVRLSLLSIDIYSSILDEHLQLDNTDRFDLQCSPNIKRN